jgi:hypothetical protein
MHSRVTCGTNRNKICVMVVDSPGRSISNWNSIAHNVGHVSTEWLAHQFSSMQEGHTRYKKKCSSNEI